FATCPAPPSTYTLSLHDALPILGASLASFADQAAAEALAAEHNGTVLHFDEIDQEFLQQAAAAQHGDMHDMIQQGDMHDMGDMIDRKSTRLNSSHVKISYAVFCL